MSDGREPAGESAAATAMTVGCVVVVILLFIGGGLSWFMMSRAQVAERAMALDSAMAEMAAMRLPEPVRAAARPQLQRIHDAVERGELEGQAGVVFIAAITNSREFVAGSLFHLSSGLGEVEGLSGEERTQGEAALARFAGGVLERTVPGDVAQGVVQGAPVGGSADDFRTWLTDVSERCEALGLQEPARRVDLEQVVKKAVDSALEKR